MFKKSVFLFKSPKALDKLQRVNHKLPQKKHRMNQTMHVFVKQITNKPRKNKFCSKVMSCLDEMELFCIQFSTFYRAITEKKFDEACKNLIGLKGNKVTVIKTEFKTSTFDWKLAFVDIFVGFSNKRDTRG